MESSYNGSQRFCPAYFLAFSLSLIGLFFLLTLVDTARTDSLSKGTEEIFASKWGTSALVDYAVGACFAATFIYLRQGPAVFSIPSTILAILYPFIGNFFLMWYISYLLLLEGDIIRALFPESDNNLLSDDQEGLPETKRQRKFFSVLFSILFVFFMYIIIRAYLGEDLMDGYKAIKASKWLSVTFLDNLVGLVFTVIYVIVREGSTSCTLSLWLLGFLLLGNLPTCLYVLVMARESSLSGRPFRQVFLSKKQNDNGVSF